MEFFEGPARSCRALPLRRAPKLVSSKKDPDSKRLRTDTGPSRIAITDPTLYSDIIRLVVRRRQEKRIICNLHFEILRIDIAQVVGIGARNAMIMRCVDTAILQTNAA